MSFQEADNRPRGRLPYCAAVAASVAHCWWIALMTGFDGPTLANGYCHREQRQYSNWFRWNGWIMIAVIAVAAAACRCSSWPTIPGRSGTTPANQRHHPPPPECSSADALSAESPRRSTTDYSSAWWPAACASVDSRLEQFVWSKSIAFRLFLINIKEKKPK